MRKVMTSVASGKILLAKTMSEFMKKLWFSISFCQINCASISAQHVRCHKEYYSPRGRAVSTSHIALALDMCGNIETVRNSEARALTQIHNRHQACGKLSIFAKFRHLTYHGCNHAKPWRGFKLFLYPMDRAEVLHTQSYDLSGRRKNTPGENDQVNS